jgi:hypothetical protein
VLAFQVALAGGRERSQLWSRSSSLKFIWLEQLYLTIRAESLLSRSCAVPDKIGSASGTKDDDEEEEEVQPLSGGRDIEMSTLQAEGRDRVVTSHGELP